MSDTVITSEDFKKELEKARKYLRDNNISFKYSVTIGSNDENWIVEEMTEKRMADILADYVRHVEVKLPENQNDRISDISYHHALDDIQKLNPTLKFKKP